MKRPSQLVMYYLNGEVRTQFTHFPDQLVKAYSKIGLDARHIPNLLRTQAI